MLVECPNCGGRGRITSRNTLSDRVVDLYCQCMNTRECGASWVETKAFKNYLNPPLNNTQRMAAHILGRLTKEERAALVQGDLFSH